MKRLGRAWSEDETALCLKYWAEGKSALECAEKLGTGRSRNSIIGLVHRAGVQRSTATKARRVVIPRSPRKLASDRARNMAITRWSSRPPKPKPVEPPPRIDPASPAALAASALLAMADEAQRRRDGYRATLH